MVSKYTRYNIPRYAHELTFSCYKRQSFLQNERIKLWLIDSIKTSSEKHNFAVWAYVIMPEHIHLMIYPRDISYSISEILKSIKFPVSRRVLNALRESNSPYINKMRTGLSNPRYRFWQDGGGYDRCYIIPNDIRKQINYIHKNPIRRGLVQNAEDYKWSSAGFWIHEKDSLIRIDISDLLIL